MYEIGGGKKCQYFRGLALEELLLEYLVTSQQESQALRRFAFPKVEKGWEIWISNPIQ